MSGPQMICPACRHVVDAGQRCCPRCGEPVEQELVAELRELHGRLRALDALVAEGLGDATVAEARGRALRATSTCGAPSRQP